MKPPQDLAGVIDALADRVNRNGLSRVDPETFHAEKSDIACELRKLARRLRDPGGRPLSSTTTWRA